MPNNPDNTNVDLRARINHIAEQAFIEDVQVATPDVTTQEFATQAPGQTITSERTFGVEIEVNARRKQVEAIREHLPRGFGLVHDGSVDLGIEVVSPILGGATGEQLINEVCGVLQKAGVTANESCGLHVHVGAEDYLEPVHTVRMRLRDVSTTNKTQVSHYLLSHRVAEYLLENHRGNTVVSRMLGKNTCNFSVSETEALFDIMQSVPTMQHFRVLFAGAAQGRGTFTYIDFENKRGKDKLQTLSMGDKTQEEIKNFCKTYQGDVVALGLVGGVRALVDTKHSADMITLCVNDNINQTHITKLKRVAAFYVAFDNVLVSLLPHHRRDNDFAKQISTRMSINDIMRVNTHDDFWNIFTKTKTRQEFQQSMGVNRHESRYYGINFRALLKHKTIEVRYHHGTINQQEILFWAALNQRIVDIAADLNNHSFDLDRLEKAAMIVSLSQKTNLFFAKLGLPQQIVEYYLAQQEKYSADDSVIVQCLLAADK